MHGKYLRKGSETRSGVLKQAVLIFSMRFSHNPNPNPQEEVELLTPSIGARLPTSPSSGKTVRCNALSTGLHDSHFSVSVHV